MANSAHVSLWQLIEPGLPNGAPATVRAPKGEFLAASACAIDAKHHAEQRAATVDPSEFGRDRAPRPRGTKIETPAPERPHKVVSQRLKDDDLLLDDRVARVGAPRGVLRGKDRRPAVMSQPPPA